MSKNNRKKWDQKYDEKRRGKRTRNWTFIVYPDSAIENWREIIDEEHIQWIESPLHDQDWNEDKTKKKSHWHVLLMFEAVKIYEQVKELTDKLNATVPQQCHGVKGLVRYMAHLDNPEKSQYKASNIIGHGGVDVAELLKPSSSERYVLIGEMREWVRQNNCLEFFELFDHAAIQRCDDWFPLLCDNSAYIMGQYIKSLRHSRRA